MSGEFAFYIRVMDRNTGELLSRTGIRDGANPILELRRFKAILGPVPLVVVEMPIKGKPYAKDVADSFNRAIRVGKSSPDMN